MLYDFPWNNKNVVWAAGVRGSREISGGARSIFDPRADNWFGYKAEHSSMYGGATTCLIMACWGDSPAEVEFIILDHGSGIVEGVECFVIPAIRYAIKCGRISDVVLHCLQSHFHLDHIGGLVWNKMHFFGDLPVRVNFYSPNLRSWRRRDIERQEDSIPETLLRMQQAFSEGVFPVSLEALGSKIEHNEFSIGQELDLGNGLQVKTCALEHPGGCCSYRIERAGNIPFAFLTDCDLDPSFLTDRIIRQAEDAVVYVDMQYTDEQKHGNAPTADGMKLSRDKSNPNGTWGHSSPGDIVELWRRCRTPPVKIIAGHHDPSNDDFLLDRMFDYACAKFAAAGLPPRVLTMARETGKTRLFL